MGKTRNHVLRFKKTFFAGIFFLSFSLLKERISIWTN